MIEIPPIEDELECIDLGDERLDRRAIAIAKRAVEAPGKSFPKMVKDASELEAFYRFFQNEDIEAKAILEPHRRATLARCNEWPLVRVAHDTTAFGFKRGERRTGANQPRTRISLACRLKPSPAMSCEFRSECWRPRRLSTRIGGRFLGLRGLKKMKGRYETHPVLPPPAPKLSREQKEAARWFKAVQEVEGLHSSARVIHVMDREADDFTLMAQMDTQNSQFVIRIKATRRLGHDLSYNISDRLQCAPTHLFRTVPLSRRKLPNVQPRMRKFRSYQPREERDATLHVRATRVVIPRPPLAETTVGSLTLNVVQVFEPAPPSREQAVEWTLLTNEPVGTSQEIEAVVDHYRARWRIEEYFRALKSGCAIEQRQLTSFAALTCALSFFAMVAWRLSAMRILARVDSPSPAATLFDAQDVEVIRFLALRRKHPLPPEPTMRAVMLALAAIGGHLKRNGDPGWITIGRGYDDFSLAREVWAANPHEK